MASITLADFKSQVADVARPNRFWVEITGGTAAGAWQEQNMAFLAKSANLPARTIGEIELNWQGMKAKIAGDPTFDDFTMTFLNDYDFNLKKFIEDWMEEIATMATNNRTDHGTYKAEILVSQLGRTGDEVLRKYKLIGAYPKQMDAIELSMESNDQAEELSVTWGYDYFEIVT